MAGVGETELITRLVVASHNAGKVREIGDLLHPLGVDTVSAAELDLPEPDETADSFVGNACLKAEAAAVRSGLWALSDDSGLVVPALGGAPGIYSARWAGPDKDFRLAMERVEAELAACSATDVSAHFVCVLALAGPDGAMESFEGRVDGALTFPPRGSRGFGYDPIFVPDGETETFGEMEPARKHAMSHRAKAFAKFMAARFAT